MRKAKLQVDGFGVSIEGIGPCGQCMRTINALEERRERARRQIQSIPALIELARGLSEWANGQDANECVSLIQRANLILKYVDGVKDEVR